MPIGNYINMQNTTKFEKILFPSENPHSPAGPHPKVSVYIFLGPFPKTSSGRGQRLTPLYRGIQHAPSSHLGNPGPPGHRTFGGKVNGVRRRLWVPPVTTALLRRRATAPGTDTLRGGSVTLFEEGAPGPACRPAAPALSRRSPLADGTGAPGSR